jgi:NADH-quinone oxidoreductase subunit M
MIQKVFYGPLPQNSPLSDFNRREWLSLAILVLATVWLGLAPQTVLNLSSLALKQEMQQAVPMVPQ